MSDERLDDGVAAQRGGELAVDVHGRDGLLESARKRDADVRVLRFAGSVDDASHHRDLHLFDAGVLLLPHRHLLAQVGLDLVGHFLEEGAGGASAAGTGGDLRGEAAQLERLQDLLADDDFLGAIAVGQRRERGADGVADAFLQQHGDSRRWSRRRPSLPMPGFGEAEVQRVIALPRRDRDRR